MRTEVDTFTMPIVDEIVEGGDAGEAAGTHQTVLREAERMNSGILIKLIKDGGDTT